MASVVARGAVRVRVKVWVLAVVSTSELLELKLVVVVTRFSVAVLVT